MQLVPDGEIERDTLRQGDIISDIHLVGTLCFKDVSVPNSVGGGSTPKIWSVHSELPTGPVTVLSYCCEVSRENGVKLTSIVLAPIRDVNKATHPDKLQELIDSNILREGETEYSYLKYFYLEPFAELPYANGGIIDFSKVFSVRKTSYDYLLERKVGQLDDATRSSMALKLALYFYRSGRLVAAAA